MEPETSFEDLPNDVLVEILSYIELKDLVHSARHVCSRWKEASEDVILWRNRVYTPAFQDSDVDVSIVLEQIPKLRSLALVERGVSSVVLRTIVKHCPHLRKLKFYANQRLSTTFLKNLAVMCPNIEFMHVPSLDSSVVSKMKAVGQLSNLKEISFEEWPDRTVALKPIADGCPNLKRINLKRKMVSYVDFAYFIEKKKNQLESLDINWRSSDFKCLIIPLTRCTKLKRLAIVDYHHTNLEASFDALSSLHSLTSLKLENFRDADIKYLIGVFKKYHLRELESLSIEEYDVYEDRLGDIIIKNCPKLKLLNLSSINLSDDSLTNVHLLQDLESVELKYTGVGDEGIKSLTSCKKIKHLDLSCCHNLSETGLLLMAEFTNLHVLKLEDISAQGLPFDLFASRLPHLKYLSVNLCNGVDREALARLKEEKPHLVVEDLEPFIYTDDEYDHGDEYFDGDDYVQHDENEAQNNGQPVLEANLQGVGANENAVALPIIEEHFHEGQPNEVEGAPPVPDDHLRGNEANDLAAAQLVPESKPEQESEEDEETNLLICVQNLFEITPDTVMLPAEPLSEDESSEFAVVQLVPEPNSGDVHFIVPEQDTGEDEEIDSLIYVQNLFRISLENVVLFEKTSCRTEVEVS